MAYTLVAHTAKKSVDVNDITSDPIDTTGANLLVVLVTNYAGADLTLATFTDNKGNSWTRLTDYGVGARDRCILWYCLNGIVGAGHTFTWDTTNNNYPNMFVQAWSGAALSGAFDQQVGNNVDGVNSTQPGALTPSQPGCLVVTGLASDSTTAAAISSGTTPEFTISDDLPFNTGTALAGSMAYQVQAGAGFPVNPTWTYSSATSSSTIASFKPAISGPSAPTLLTMTPSSTYGVNATVPVKLVGVAFTGTGLDGTAGAFNTVSGFTFSNLSIAGGGGSGTVDIQIAAAKAVGTYNFTFTTSGGSSSGTSGAIVFTIASPSGGTTTGDTGGGTRFNLGFN